jgi:hypothetical protein
MGSRDAIVYGLLNKVPIFSKKLQTTKINGKLKNYRLLQEQNHSIFWWDDTEHMLYFYTLIFKESISIETVRISFFQRLGNTNTLLWSSWVFFLFSNWLRVQISQISWKCSVYTLSMARLLLVTSNVEHRSWPRLSINWLYDCLLTYTVTTLIHEA